MKKSLILTLCLVAVLTVSPKSKLPTMSDKSKELDDQDYLADYNKASKEYEKQVEKEEVERIAENKAAIEKKKKEMKELADMKEKNNCDADPKTRLKKKAKQEIQGTIPDQQWAQMQADINTQSARLHKESRYSTDKAEYLHSTDIFEPRHKQVDSKKKSSIKKRKRRLHKTTVPMLDAAGQVMTVGTTEESEDNNNKKSENNSRLNKVFAEIIPEGDCRLGYFPAPKKKGTSEQQMINHNGVFYPELRLSKESVVPSKTVQPSRHFRLKQVEDSSETREGKIRSLLEEEKKKHTTLPHIYKDDETYEKEKLKATLMTEEKFLKDFPDRSWEDAKYVQRISEFGKQDLKARMTKKQKLTGVIKTSFIRDKDRRFNEYPEMQAQAQDAQFTEVMTPVQSTPFQKSLWEDFHSSHFHNVDYNSRSLENTEHLWDKDQQPHLYEKIVSKKPVHIQTTSMQMDINSAEDVLNDLGNPLHGMEIQKETNRDYQVDPSADIQSQNTRNGLDGIMSQISKEMKSLRKTKKKIRRMRR